MFETLQLKKRYKMHFIFEIIEEKKKLERLTKVNLTKVKNKTLTRENS